MNTTTAKTITVAAAILGMALATPAAALTVTYTVGGVGPTSYPAPTPPPPNAPHVLDGHGYPGDTVEFEAYTDSLELISGTYVKKINTLLWTIDYTYGGTSTDPDAWSDLSFTVNAPRSITVHTSNGALAQTGSMLCTWENDRLGFGAGSTITFTIAGCQVHVTPVALAPVWGYLGFTNMLSTESPQAPMCDLPCAQPARDVMAQFVVEGVVPVEPTTWSRVKGLYE